MTKLFKSQVLMRRIDKFEAAVAAKAFIGTIEREDERAEIENDYRKARHQLISYILEHVL